MINFGIKISIKHGIILLIFILLLSCGSTKKLRLEKDVSTELALRNFNEHFTGLMIYDLKQKDTLFHLNSNKYFLPASNTKIFTLYSAIKMLGDSISALDYATQQDTLYFRGTGDPSGLHPDFNDSTLIKFLKQFKKLVYVPRVLEEGRFGPGWAWEDYDRGFAPERSVLPLYGNVVNLWTENNELKARPTYFKDSTQLRKTDYRRTEDFNRFYFDPLSRDTLAVPYKTSPLITKALLESILDKPIEIKMNFPSIKKQSLYGIRTDTLYKVMMKESDNFLAEQLLVLASSEMSDTLSGKRVREFVLDSYLSEMPHKPRWVDGSGLSRYNLFTPASMVYVLNELYQEMPQEQLFSIFPAGGKEGTLENWYAGNGSTYIYAKSGTLGNTYCLSGYLITRSEKILIFSFMNNHFRIPTSAIKQKMQEVLEFLRDAY